MAAEAPPRERFAGAQAGAAAAGPDQAVGGSSNGRGDARAHPEAFAMRLVIGSPARGGRRSTTEGRVQAGKDKEPGSDRAPFLEATDAAASSEKATAAILLSWLWRARTCSRSFRWWQTAFATDVPFATTSVIIIRRVNKRRMP